MGAALAIIAWCPCDGCSHRAPPEARKAYVTGHGIAKHVPYVHPSDGKRDEPEVAAEPGEHAVERPDRVGFPEVVG